MEKHVETSTSSTAKGETPSQETKPKKPLIVGLPGSLREGSFAKKALRIALNSCGEETTTSLIDLDLLRKLPFRDGLDPQSQNYPQSQENIDAFRNLVQEADGIIISTPDYHNSFSGTFFFCFPFWC